MKKMLCFLFGHKIVSTTCPYTKATYSQCDRCAPKTHSKSTFN